MVIPTQLIAYFASHNVVLTLINHVTWQKRLLLIIRFIEKYTNMLVVFLFAKILIGLKKV